MEDFGVDLLHAGESMTYIMGFDDLEALFAHGGLEFGLLEYFGDATCDGGGVAGGAKEAVLVRLDQFGDGAGADGDDG